VAQYYTVSEVQLVAAQPALLHPRHVHRLFPATGTYNCNSCLDDNLAHSGLRHETTPRFRCQACDWDACLPCMLQVAPRHPFVVHANATAPQPQLRPVTRPEVGDRVVSLKDDDPSFRYLQEGTVLKDDRDASPCVHAHMRACVRA
jgi:hypothetical protein